ncbi:MAG: hypothetical protein IJJ99_00025 [Oscillospiraceae bacterium]|nr:hypothetical protein [Oscillospiraceae bacterium]
MDWKYFRQILKIFFGVCLILISVALFLYNAFFLESGYDIALGLLDLILFLSGLLLVIFAAARLPSDRAEER